MTKRKTHRKKCPECGCNLKFENYVKHLENVHQKSLTDKEKKNIKRQIVAEELGKETERNRKMLLEKGYTRCVFCKKLVKPKALRCRHCGRILSHGKKIVVISIVCLFFAVVVVGAYYTQMKNEGSINPGGNSTGGGTSNSRPSVPAFSMMEAGGHTFSIVDFKGSVIVLQFMQIQSDCQGHYYYKGVLLEDVESIPQFDAFKTTCANYCSEGSCDRTDIKHRVVFITAVIPPSCCGDPMAFSKQLETRFGVNWFIACDTLDYTTTKAFVSYLEFGQNNALDPDPFLIFIDKNQCIESTSGYTDSSALASKLNALLAGSYGTDVYTELNAQSDVVESENAVTWGMFGGMFVLGILTSAAPCCIVLFVTTITYIINVCMRPEQNNSNKKVPKKLRIWKATKHGTLIGLTFTFGMALVFFVIGCVISYFNIFTQGQNIAMAFSVFTGIVLILFGLDSVGAFSKVRERIRSRSQAGARANSCRTTISGSCACRPRKKGVLERLRLWGIGISKNYVLIGSFFLGMLFGLAWIPCAVGLILPVVLLLMTQKISMLMGGLLFFVFGLGHGIPFVPIASATSAIRAKITEKMIKIGKWMMEIFGIIIIALGVNMILTVLGIRILRWW